MRMPLRRRLVRLRDWRCPAFLPVLLTAALLFAGFRAVFNARLRPAIETMALSSAKNRISETVSRAVADCIAEQQLSYQDFITMETDASGQITCLTSNLSAASLLRQEIVGYITEELDALRQESFGIPVGTLTGWLLLSGKGPSIRVELLSFGDVDAQLSQRFEEAGINQTLHQVFLDVSVTVYLLIPGETLTAETASRICVAETVIVGQVPDTYLYVGNGENQYG